MRGAQSLAAALAALLLTTGITARGFTPAQLAGEAGDERVVNASPGEAQARLDELALASYVHRMGTPGDERTARYVQKQLAAAGWDAKIVTYVVPIVWPVKQSLRLLGKNAHDVDLYEPAVPGDPYSRDHASIGIPYSGYSNDGDVTGPIVYANRATADDFKALAGMGVSVRGAIVLARGGGGALTAKAFEAAKHGARAVLVFNDPMSSGYFMGEPYPKGPWRPPGGAMRNTMTFTNDPGDPTAIGIPVPGAKHKPFAAIKLPSIPEAPVTGLVARELLQAMGGPVGPSTWHPGFAFPLHVGGDVRARFVLRSKRFFGPIWDVVATMRGSQPEAMVVVGGHRDAWTYGAVDPISGTVDLLQLGRALGKLKAAGWKPRRTIVIGSWDGEELNLFGSDEWVEQHAADLRAGCVAYVNTDEVAFGPTFGVYTTPDLAGALRDASTAATGPTGTTLSQYWSAQDPKRLVDDIGGGSDHEAFVYHEGIPGAGAGFGGPFGTYHSAYDDPASLAILDPGYHRSAAAARYTSLVVLRLANAAYPDLRLADLANAIRDRLVSFAKENGDDARRSAVLALLGPDAETFAHNAVDLDARANAAVARGDEAASALTYAQLRAAEGAFFDAQTPAWQRTLLYDANGRSSLLPTLSDTLGSNGDAVLSALHTALQAAAAAAAPPK